MGRDGSPAPTPNPKPNPTLSKVGRSRFGKTDPAALCTLATKELRRLQAQPAQQPAAQPAAQTAQQEPALQPAVQPAAQPWLSTIIDEAHELRNPFSFWGIGAMLAGCNRR